MRTRSDLAVIIVSYNTCRLLRNCLCALEASSGIQPSVWVVDNASQDGSTEMVRTEFPAVHLVEPGHNLGFAAANNLALRQMGFGSAAPSAHLPEFVLFLNPDTEVRTDALARLRAFLQTTPRAGVVGPALIYPDGSFQHSAFRFPTLWQVWFDLVPWPGRFVESPLNGRYPRALYTSGQPFRIDHPLGAAFMTRAQVIQQVGLMDEGFFMYAEEIDWCMRVKRAGWEIYCLPSAVVMHYAGGSTRQQLASMNEVLWRSRFRL
ncbi:MAG: glycosyltransferase family 2 protein, partial [Anaerolineae bacterium]|nr:glycosyltransferase family 2 protein [Anaerolineae bacterium]